MDNIQIQKESTPLITATITDGETPRDLSSLTTNEFIVKPPTAVKYAVNTVFENDGTDGKVKYQVVKGEIDAKGEWRFQYHGENAGTEIFTEIARFEVRDNL